MRPTLLAGIFACEGHLLAIEIALLVLDIACWDICLWGIFACEKYCLWGHGLLTLGDTFEILKICCVDGACAVCRVCDVATGDVVVGDGGWMIENYDCNFVSRI